MAAAMKTASQSATELLLREVKGGCVSLLLNRPRQRNALSKELLLRLRDELGELEKDGGRSCRAVLIRSYGGGAGVFCSGHDLKEISANWAVVGSRSEKEREELQELFGICSEVMISITKLPQPVIAVVRGVASAAGCQLVAACDLAVASKQNAKFTTPGVDIGLFCSTPSVAIGRAVGNRKAAMDMLLTARMVSADEALRIGLVSHVVDDSEVDSFSNSLAENIASRSGVALSMGKRAFQAHMSVGNLEEAYTIASKAMVENMLTHDAKEGIQAFIDKRKPSWKHE